MRLAARQPAGQRRLKAAVVTEQLQRLAGIAVTVEVEELPGGALGWRTRIGYAVDGKGRVGLRRHRSHHVEPIAECLLGVEGVGDAPELARRWPGVSALDIATGDAGERSVLTHRPVAAAPRTTPAR